MRNEPWERQDKMITDVASTSLEKKKSGHMNTQCFAMTAKQATVCQPLLSNGSVNTGRC
jgi:hypothetical protein